MRKNIEVADQRRFVADMNHQFEAGSQSGTFATALVLSFFAPTRSLSVSNAGHPPPLIYRHLTGRWEYLDRSAAEDRSPQAPPTGLPWGIFPHTNYHERKCRLDRDDAVLCFTDAFIEAQRADGSPLEMQGFAELVAAATPYTDGADLMARLLRSVRALHPENLHQDDATLVLFCATGERFRLRDQWMAPFRMLFSQVSDASTLPPCVRGVASQNDVM